MSCSSGTVGGGGCSRAYRSAPLRASIQRIMSASNPSPLIFNKAQHIKYWLRCLKTHLPNQYTSNDSQRITFAFFTLSALDLLGVLHDRTSESERAEYTEWLYRCQHPDGGFRGFTGADVGVSRPDKTPGPWDPANLAATFFALVALAVLGDTMDRVKRRECLVWLEKLQLEDGSFGEAMGEGGKIEGGGDVRYCYLAAAVRRILRGEENSGRGEEGSQDIDVPALVGFITSSQVRMGSTFGKRHTDGEQSYEGGIAQAPFHEAHGTHFVASAASRNANAHVEMQLGGPIVALVHYRCSQNYRLHGTNGLCLPLTLVK